MLTVVKNAAPDVRRHVLTEWSHSPDGANVRRLQQFTANVTCHPQHVGLPCIELKLSQHGGSNIAALSLTLTNCGTHIDTLVLGFLRCPR